MKRLLEVFKAAMTLQRVELFISGCLLVIGLALLVPLAFSIGRSRAISDPRNVFDVVGFSMMALVMALVMCLVVWLVVLVSNRVTQTNRRLRGLADYVEGLRAYTVPRIDSIEDFLEKNTQKEDPQPPPSVVPTEPITEKPLNKKERDTLLTIIAVLAKEAKIDIIKMPGKSAQYISGLTDGIGANVSKRAIEEHLKKIPDALETRMK